MSTQQIDPAKRICKAWVYESKKELMMGNSRRDAIR